MELVSIGLFGYQRFETDSGDMDVTGSPVAIVGPNEAGKTSLLEALEHLNEAGPFADRNRTRGYDEDICVRARFVLDEDDLGAIKGVGGLGSPVLFHVSKRTGSHAVRSRLEPPIRRDLAARVKARATIETLRKSKWLSHLRDEDETAGLLDEVLTILGTEDDLPDEERARVAAAASHLSALAQDSKAAGRAGDQLTALVTLEAQTHPDAAARTVLLNRRPRFLMFDVKWRQLESAFDFSSGPSEVMLALFALIDFDLDALREAMERNDATEVAELRNQANARFATLFKDRWNQANVRVEVSISQSLIHVFGRSPSGRLIPIAERSAGLRQFIALLAFVGRETAADQRVILLIDEAETHLHYDAQADLINVFARQRVVDKIIYTTHSAGCLPLDLGTGVRVVEPIGPDTIPTEDWERSRIRNAFWTTGPGFSPLLMAMGAGSFAFSALRRAVIGEGPSEVILLPTLLREATGKESLTFQVAPGVSTVRPKAVRELDASAARLAYVVDGDEGGFNHRDKLIENGVAEERIIVLGADSTEALAVEDLIERAAYVVAVNRVLERYRKPKVPDDRIGNAERKSQVETWCDHNEVEPPSEREVAQQVLEVARERRLRGEDVSIVEPARRTLILQLHDAITALLNPALPAEGAD